MENTLCLYGSKFDKTNGDIESILPVVAIGDECSDERRGLLKNRLYMELENFMADSFKEDITKQDIIALHVDGKTPKWYNMLRENAPVTPERICETSPNSVELTLENGSFIYLYIAEPEDA